MNQRMFVLGFLMSYFIHVKKPYKAKQFKLVVDRLQDKENIFKQVKYSKTDASNFDFENKKYQVLLIFVCT